MPCRSDYPDESYERATKKVDRLTRMLCNAMQFVEKNQGLGGVSPEVRAWWGDHKLADRRRAQAVLDRAKKDIDKKKLIEKLTPYEKQLLGIK